MAEILKFLAGFSKITLMEYQAEDGREGLYALKRSLMQAGRELIDLSMFNPDLPPPRFVIDKLLEATVKSSNHRYGVSRGIRKLREAFASKYWDAFKVKLDPETQICASLGSKDALERALYCLRVAGYGPSLIVGTPTYPAHRFTAHLNGLVCVYFRIDRDENVMLASIRELVQRHPRSVLLLNFPNNPCGMSVSRDFYAGVLEAATGSRGFVLNDFVYGEMRKEAGAFCSLLKSAGSDAPCAETYSLSKAYSVPGWRVGALCGHKDLVSHVSALKSQADYGLFLPLQMAAAAALSSPQDMVKETAQIYRRRCELIGAGLKDLGWEVSFPEAGACVWARMPDMLRRVPGVSADPSVAYCRSVLEQYGVTALPGSEFGEDWKEFVRFAAVVPEERLREVLIRLAGFQTTCFDKPLMAGDLAIQSTVR